MRELVHVDDWNERGSRKGVASDCNIAFDWVREMITSGRDDFRIYLDKEHGYWHVEARTQFTRETHPFGEEYWDTMNAEIPFLKKLREQGGSNT